jgi:dipeptidyl aminopeptidase/acylaminoacyl peptidase
MDDAHHDLLYTWSPDGSKLAVVAGMWPQEGDLLNQSGVGIYVWELGKGFTAFQNSESQYFLQPAWSPDAKFLAYENDTRLFVESLDGTHLVDITRFLNADYSQFPHWSPDGQRIAFSSSRRVMEPPGSHLPFHNENDEIIVVSSDGSNPMNLSQHPAKDVMPKWSPDGKWIAFFSDRDGYFELFVMKSDGSSARKAAKAATLGLNLTEFSMPRFPWSDSGLNYTWLPGGKYILYQDQLIDLESGDILRFPVPSSSASISWFVPPVNQDIASIPTPHCAVGWSQLYEGIHAIVTGTTDEPPNRVRNSPTTDAEVVSQLYPGTIVKVAGGPICENGLVFWQVEHESIPNGAGWTVEGDAKGTSYFLEPVKP